MYFKIQLQFADSHLFFFFPPPFFFWHERLEIYRIVSSKALEPGESGPQIGGRTPITITGTPQENTAKDGKCC